MGIFQTVTGMKITHYTINSENIPLAFSGFKIVHLSDFHCEPKRGMILGVKNEKPDVIFMTGDMTDDKKPYGCFLKLLEAMLSIAPVYIVSGNHDAKRHDYIKLVEICRKMGAVYFRDSSEILKRGSDEITIYGLEDSGAREGKTLDAKIKNSLNSLERHGGYEILLFHRANKLEATENKNFDLIFSGHMHGGQIRLPYFGGIAAPKSSMGEGAKMLFPKYSGGRYKVGKTDVIVNCGMGNPVGLPRFGNPTEIVSATLNRSEE